MHALPNLLSGFRLAMVPVLGALAWAGTSPLFLAALVLSLASDAVDGFVARRTGCVSVRGAKLDSWADLATWSTLPIFAWWLWPDLMRDESRYLALAVAAFAAPTLVGLLRFGRLTSYHTWLAKLSAVLVGAAALALFGGGPAWPFHVATIVLIVEAVEEIAITATLREWRADVPTLWHAVRGR
jgi:CDP-diacylglycerol--glycerol-3-phosphate 3-phosphatidyltransferase